MPLALTPAPRMTHEHMFLHEIRQDFNAFYSLRSLYMYTIKYDTQSSLLSFQLSPYALQHSSFPTTVLFICA